MENKNGNVWNKGNKLEKKLIKIFFLNLAIEKLN